MRKIVITEFLTLDGVMEAPDKWSLQYWNEQVAQFKLEEIMTAEALLLGRVTYEGFAAAWPGMSDPAGFADKMNSMPKYVVTTTMSEGTWNNTTIIKSDIAGEIAKLKEGDGGPVLVAGSSDLIQFLLANNLVDEIQVLVYPIAIGAGKRLFQEGTQVKVNLIETASYESVALLRYEVIKPTA